MKIKTVGIDLAKNVVQIRGVNSRCSKGRLPIPVMGRRDIRHRGENAPQLRPYTAYEFAKGIAW